MVNLLGVGDLLAVNTAEKDCNQDAIINIVSLTTTKWRKELRNNRIDTKNFIIPDTICYDAHFCLSSRCKL